MHPTSTPCSMPPSEVPNKTGEVAADGAPSGAAFVHPSAAIHGDVQLGRGSSVWVSAVIRAEIHAVDIGPYANVQDFVMMHVGVRIGANCLICINATGMDGCRIGANCVIGAGAVLIEGTEVPDNAVVVGGPAKVAARRDNFVANRLNAFAYHHNAFGYGRGDHRAWASAAYARAEAAECERLEMMGRRSADLIEAGARAT